VDTLLERERELAAVRALLLTDGPPGSASDTSFALLHGLYWLAANLADRAPLLIAVDDAHWADEPSLRWLAHLAARLDGLPLTLIVAMRPREPRSLTPSFSALQGAASEIVRPAPLSGAAVADLVRGAVGAEASDELCATAWSATGGPASFDTPHHRRRNRASTRATSCIDRRDTRSSMPWISCASGPKQIAGMPRRMKWRASVVAVVARSAGGAPCTAA